MWQKWIKPYFYAVVMIGLVFQVWCFAWLGLYRIGLAPYTAFMKSEQMRLMTAGKRFGLEHQWVDYANISDNLKRAVITSEDAGFVDHDGVDWSAIEVARKRNNRAGKPSFGGSTISMQLTKNLFLSSNKSYLRKVEEIAMTYAMEVILPKEQILEIYLNSVEWGEGVFGAEAAAKHYFKSSSSKLTAQQSAKLAVMLPAPKKYDLERKNPYIARRANVILKRMRAAQIPDDEGI